jgi:thioester reductase-like protein
VGKVGRVRQEEDKGGVESVRSSCGHSKASHSGWKGRVGVLAGELGKGGTALKEVDVARLQGM